DRGDDAERAVEPAARGDAVEVRAAPDLRQLRPAPRQTPDEVADRVPRDLEPRLLHPARRELEGLLLLAGQRGPVRAAAAADRVQLVESLEDACRRYRRNGLIGLAPVETITLFVSR